MNWSPVRRVPITFQIQSYSLSFSEYVRWQLILKFTNLVMQAHRSQDYKLSYLKTQAVKELHTSSPPLAHRLVYKSHRWVTKLAEFHQIERPDLHSFSIEKKIDIQFRNLK